MAYGGAGPVGGSGSASTIKQVKLERESELRIEVGNDAPLRLRLLNGTAEIFGTELPPEIWLNFPPRLKFAVISLLIKFFVVFTFFSSSFDKGNTTLCCVRCLLGLVRPLKWTELLKLIILPMR